MKTHTQEGQIKFTQADLVSGYCQLLRAGLCKTVLSIFSKRCSWLFCFVELCFYQQVSYQQDTAETAACELMVWIRKAVKWSVGKPQNGDQGTDSSLFPFPLRKWEVERDSQSLTVMPHFYLEKAGSAIELRLVYFAFSLWEQSFIAQAHRTAPSS